MSVPLRFLAPLIIIAALVFMPKPALADPGLPREMSCDAFYGLPEITRVFGQIAEKTIPSPFGYACKKGVRPLEQPGRWQRSYADEDMHGNKTRDFLILLGKKAQHYLKANADQNQRLIKCMGLPKTDGACKNEHEYLDLVPEAAKSARENLALAQAIDESERGLSHSVSPNGGLLKQVHWKKYSEGEMTKAREALRAKRDEISKMVRLDNEEFQTLMRDNGVEVDQLSDKQKQSLIRTTRDESLSLIRTHYEREYTDLVSNQIILQYIESENPSSDEIRDALLTLESNRKNEDGKVAAAITGLQNGETVDSRHLWMLGYRPLIEEVLLEHPEFCTLASSLVATRKNIERQNLLLFVGALPLLTAAMMVPPVAGAIAAVAGAAWAPGAAVAVISGGSSLFWISKSYDKFSNTASARGVGVMDKDAIVGPSDLATAADTLVSDAAYSAGFMGLKAGQIINSGSVALKVGAKVFAKNLPRNSARALSSATMRDRLRAIKVTK